MAGGSGFKKSKLNAAYTKANKQINYLCDYMNKYVKDIADMNVNVWNGGTAATTWYNAANKSYLKDVKFYNKIVKLNNKIKKKAANAPK